MTALTVTALITIAIIGLVVIAELVAVTLLLLRVSKLSQQVRDKVDPVVNQSTQLLHKANDVADTVKSGTQKVTDTVAGMTTTVAGVGSRIATRVDTTTETVGQVTNAAVSRLTSPPVLTALAIFTGLRVASSAQRILSWPLLSLIALAAGVPAGVRAWRSYQRSRRQPAPVAATEPAHLVLRPGIDEDVLPRAA